MANRYSGVLLDFAGTLFDLEDEQETLRVIGVPASAELSLALSRADQLARTPALMPPDLLPQWEGRDLTADIHRDAYLGLFHEAGIPADVAEAFYTRACSPEAWVAFEDTVSCLRELGERGLPVAVVSNIGWDLRPVFERQPLLHRLPRDRHGPAGGADDRRQCRQ